MSTAPRTHRKLPGGGLNWNGHGRLWQGEDHLLEVTSVLVLEQYRRFFFHDTQAFTVQRTGLRLAWALVQSALALIFGLATWACWWFGRKNSEEDWHVVLYVFAAILGAVALVFFVMLVINLVLGPSCRCSILTPMGWHTLTAPGRLRPALRVQAQIIPLIEAAQARLAEANPVAS